MADAEAERVRRLEAELRAAHKTIAALMRRLELDGEQQDPDRFAIHKAIASLENILAQRTRELSASEDRYRALYDHSPDMILMVDGEGLVTAANPTTERALRQEQKDLVGQPLGDLFAPEGREQLTSALTRGNLPYDSLELPLRGHRYVSLTAAPVPGFSDALQVVLRDVTARRALESELQQARRLAAIGHLAAGVAHEINNPLAVMQLRLELLERSTPALPDEALRQVRVVADHVQRIARIVKNLQTFARPRVSEREPVALERLLDGAREIAGLWLESVEVELTLNPPDVCIQADPGQMEQVFANLLTNAADAMGRRGRIRIAGEADGAVVRLRVEDEGPGIPEDLLEDVFTPFVSGKAAQRGTGLGLAIVWGIVQEHGGTVRASNRGEGGACIELVLPRGGDEVVLHADEEPLAEPVVRPLRVLCVEDEPGLLQMVRDLGDEVGHQIVCVPSVAEAAVRITQQPFDVVLTDIRLPDGSGLAMLERLRATHPALVERAILMSGLFHEPEPGRRYLQKPFSRRQLLRAIEEAAGGG